jgi:hypothetical protein
MSKTEMKQREAFLKKERKRVKGSEIAEDVMFLNYNEKVKNYKTAIKAMCVHCIASNRTGDCPSVGCPLWLFRKGKNPFDQRGKKGGNTTALVKARAARKKKLAKRGKK